MQYKILKEERMPPFKRSLDIETPNQLGSAEIIFIANRLLELQFDLTFLVFYTPGMILDIGGYASIKIDKKNNKINITELSAPKIHKIHADCTISGD